MRGQTETTTGGRRRRTAAEHVEAPEHAGPLDGAERIGEAALDDRVVRIGVFPDGRARFQATACPSLAACAEEACRALEAGVAPSALDERAIRARVAHAKDEDRAALVAAALRAAFPVPLRPEAP